MIRVAHDVYSSQAETATIAVIAPRPADVVGRGEHMPIVVKVGQRIAALRKRAKMTQRQLADAVGTAPEVISRMEHGTYGPSLERLDEIARALAVAPRDLLDFEGMYDGDTPLLDARDRLILRLSGKLRQRSVKQINALLQIVDSMESATDRE